MGNKNKRARLARAVDHFRSIGEKVHTTQFYDLLWLQGQVKAAIRMARQVDNVLAIYGEDMHQDIVEAVKEALDAND